ncbi:DNA-processing protein DprA [Minwuia sp.]|uniref:DNA-processing protein DprA n=1 Tax=Minwuia sp. TaxID=2493630 RepID=UPI003A94101E
MDHADTDRERLARLRLIRSENVGPVNFGRLLARFGSAVDALDALPDIAAKAGRRKLRIATDAEAQREWEATEKFGARFLMLGDPLYPPLLAAAEGAPPVLAIQGDIKHLSSPALAIVGARNASANGRALCRKIAGELGRAGLVIVSGLARGIDAEAHEASIETGTIAAIAGGIDVIYPPENRKLHERMAVEGLIVAESPFGTQPRARHFPKRNRIISGLSQGVLVVEAALRSGSLITARQAGEQGRDVFAIPGSPLDPRARGANRLIRDGARLVESADDILEELGPQDLFVLRAPTASPEPRAMPASEPLKPGDEDQARRAILESLSVEPTDADALIRATGLPAPVFNTIMLELEIVGQVQRHAGNRYALEKA